MKLEIWREFEENNICNHPARQINITYWLWLKAQADVEGIIMKDDEKSICNEAWYKENHITYKLWIHKLGRRDEEGNIYIIFGRDNVMKLRIYNTYSLLFSVYRSHEIYW